VPFHGPLSLSLKLCLSFTDFHAWWLKRRELAQGCAF